MSAPPEQQSKESPPPTVASTEGFFRTMGLFENVPESTKRAGFFSDLIRGLIRADRVELGHVVCSLTVKPAFVNPYNTLHGGVVAAVAETVALACAKTVVGDRELFIGETNTAYLSAARLNAEVEVDAQVLRQGKSVIVTSVDLKVKKTGQVFYTSRVTFYVVPAASL